jgi:hypothetical protein
MTARIVGVLFIIATVSAIVGGALVEEQLKRSNALTDVAGRVAAWLVLVALKYVSGSASARM